MDVTTVSPKFQVVIALPGCIELVPSQSAAALRRFLPGPNTFQREGDRL